MGNRVFISGGGTGGHIYPAIAIASIVEKIGIDDITYIGNKNKMEKRIVSDYPYEFFSIPMVGMPRKLNFKMVWFILSLIISIAKLIPLFIFKRPKMVIGTGGFVTFPPLLVGRLFGCKIVIQEQNTFPGVVNRVIGKIAHKVLLGFSDAEKFFKKEKCELVGNPINKTVPENSDSQRVLSEFLNCDKNAIVETVTEKYNKRILIFGGSLGASKINALVNEFTKNHIDYLKKEKILIIWLTGKNDHYVACDAIKDNMITMQFTNDMDLIYSFTDVVICRSGAMTVFELYQNRLPSLLIPFPYATANHQYYNALFLKNMGVANIITEDELDRAIFEKLVIETIENDELKINYRSSDTIDPHARIEDILIKMLNPWKA